MSVMFPIGSTGDFRFEPASLARQIESRWPGTEVVTSAQEDAGGFVVLHLPPAVPHDDRRPELCIDVGGAGVVMEGIGPDRAAEVAAWVAQSTPVPDDGSVVLFHWGDDEVPLTPRTTAEELLSAFR